MTREKMRSLLLVLLTSLAILLVFSPANAQDTTTFYLNGVGSGSSLAGVYTSPYSGGTTAGAMLPVICDDFADESFVPESWTANVTSQSSLTSGTTDTLLKWLNTPGATIVVDGYTLDQAAAYAVASVLAVDILGNSGQAQEDYSYALWALFDPTDALNQLNNAGDATDAANATSDLNNAVVFTMTPTDANQVQTDVSETTIYSYVAGSGTTCPAGSSCPPPPQEFLTVNTPEPSAFLLLALGLISAMLLQLRKSRSSVLLDPFPVNR